MNESTDKKCDNFQTKFAFIRNKNITIDDYIKKYVNNNKKGKILCKNKHELICCAIKYGKIIGYKLYEKEKGGINNIKFNKFYDDFIKNKYEDNLLILDNARFHKSKDVIDNITKSKNKIIYSLPYNPNLNPIENLFSQIKSHVKNKSPDNFEELKKTIDNIIKYKITKDHLKNYFNYLFTQANDYINKNVN
jgi:transposase